MRLVWTVMMGEKKSSWINWAPDECWIQESAFLNIDVIQHILKLQEQNEPSSDFKAFYKFDEGWKWCTLWSTPSWTVLFVSSPSFHKTSKQVRSPNRRQSSPARECRLKYETKQNTTTTRPRIHALELQCKDKTATPRHWKGQKLAKLFIFRLQLMKDKFMGLLPSYSFRVTTPSTPTRARDDNTTTMRMTSAERLLIFSDTKQENHLCSKTVRGRRADTRLRVHQTLRQIHSILRSASTQRRVYWPIL